MKRNTISLGLVLNVCIIAFMITTVRGETSSNPKILQAQLNYTLDYLQNFWTRAQAFQEESKLGDLGFPCAICGIAVNEVEGLLAENRTETEIEEKLQEDLCSNLSGELEEVCAFIVDQLPFIVDQIENRWTVSTICVDLNICEAPFPNHTDPFPIPSYTINLDLPPAQRWVEVCSNSTYQQLLQRLVTVVEQVVPDQGSALLWFGKEIHSFLHEEYAQEIQGCADNLGVDAGWLTLLNIGYEVSDACTSIVAQTNDGTIMHARNLDFWAGMGFTDTLKGVALEATFEQSGNMVFKGTTFAGFVGILSGIRPGAFSITIDTRFYPDGVKELLYEIVAAIKERNATLVTLLSREALMTTNDFESAVSLLSNAELVCDVYYICAGVNPSEGAVISRNRLNASDVWRLDPPNTWFLLETNYDHWKPAPWYDDRRDPGNHYMKEMGRDKLSLEGLWNVISTKPVLNIQTTYSILAVPKDGTYHSATRWCPYPCTQ